MQMKSFSTDELKAREKDILHGLEELLGEASFYKLPHSVMLDAIGEENVAEKMVVKVSPENYATLQFWVIGMDVVPFDDRPWYVIAEERARSYKNRTFRQLDPLSKYNFRRSFVAQIRSQLWKKARFKLSIFLNWGKFCHSNCLVFFKFTIILKFVKIMKGLFLL